ncbi:4-(cytidine 5'-diphospho)-2-C-methyl-D-erythritol kinase [Candidatus Pelagibacter sp.]|nr:4-(cytidine 5'-diphospho)-2-C-methyl-D-erythritol kinase [Candidatus Pelagibacter sp.]
MAYRVIKSNAKVNIALNITGKAKNLHKIESIVAFVSFYDVIFLKKIQSQKHIIIFSGRFSKDIPKNNSVSKLFNILDKQKLLNNQKFKIRINKNIPSEAGLGGGSMNAANILKYLIKYKIIKLNKKQISTICKSIGSDVILGLNSTYTVLKSNSEIKQLKNCEKFYTLIVKPNFGCSTKIIYSRVKKFSKPKLNNPLKKMIKFNYLKNLNNSLETIAFSRFPKLKRIKYHLENSSNEGFVRMTGSGSALVAYFKSKKICNNVKKKFKKKYKNYWCIVAKTI